MANAIWSDDELAAAARAYLDMLRQEIAGHAYIKRDITRSLLEPGAALETRTLASVEYRMQNISAVMEEMGLPRIKGYMPAKNIGTDSKERLKALLIEQGALQIESYAPTSNYQDFDERVRDLVRFGTLSEPQGQHTPRAKAATTQSYERDPKVKAWVLQQAQGRCEGCGSEAPFCSSDGTPYLEVHHVITLSDGGPDTCGNTAALCPNCHRRAHFASDRHEFTNSLYQKIGRLKGMA